jgi:hypothetical protein
MLETVEELQLAFGDLERMVAEACQDLHHNVMKVLMHIGYSVAEIVVAMDHINWRSQHWVSQIGDMDILQKNSGCQGITLVKAVAKAMAAHESPSKDLSGGLEELSGVIAAVNSNLAKTCKKLLNKKIRALEQQLGAAPLAAPTLPALTMSTLIHDDHRDCVTTLGGLLQKNADLKRDNTLLV